MAHWRTTTFLKILTILLLSVFHPITAVKTPTATTTTTEKHLHPKFPCKPPHQNVYPFCNTSLPIDTRAQSLLSLLTLDEKILQLSSKAGPIPRLGLPAYEWWSESLHGISTNGYGVNFNGTIPAATSFPQVLLTSASFNRSLWSAIATAIAVEGRAMYNLGQAGLTFWAPNINIFRDPRWGRGQETPGEDPMVTAAYSVEYVRAFQGEYLSGGSQKLMLSACCKHYTAYDLESWGNFSRYTFNAKVLKQDMEDTYQPPFRSCIEDGGASCLMCSYNQVDGVPACARHDLLQKARTEWGFNGYITSDCDAVSIIYKDQKYASSPEDAVAAVLKAGMDINCGTYLLEHTQSAVEKGKVGEEDIDRALLNIFSVQLRLGLFDGDPKKQQFGNLGPHDVCNQDHRKLTLEASRQGIVLLKNDRKFLPLKKNTITSLAIIGPAANDTSNLGGGYSGIPCNPKSIFEGHKSYIQKTLYASGCLDVPCKSDDGFEEAIHVAKMADVVVVVAGLDPTQESEEHDRLSLLLPGKQMDLVLAVAHASKRPIVVILMGGGPLDVSFAKDHPLIASILWVGYPGEAGGKAVAEVIFGEFNPGGRLPVTWYPESFTHVAMTDMRMRADPSRGYPGRTYRFYRGDVVYRFGYGLSYSEYYYKFISAPDRISLSGSVVEANPNNRLAYERKDGFGYIHIDDVACCDALRFNIQISVVNNGYMDGSHVVMLFSRAVTKLKGAPLKQLIGFKRLNTVAYKAIETSILIDPCKHFSMVNHAGLRVLSLGAHVLMLEGVEHSIFIET
ncbi:probable beta-D-xylosidase 6 isoform X1 [Magnolia sinica]|uniref:probable beta-D-xylosidase 6 isoform X1 n=1 Tax=Magnolia sinica TaxID=86752 RepID=UPI002657F85B|nr:probable beta-D-xylosidase 6 isoform X1 [Magnolia sinica]